MFHPRRRAELNPPDGTLEGKLPALKKYAKTVFFPLFEDNVELAREISSAIFFSRVEGWIAMAIEAVEKYTIAAVRRELTATAEWVYSKGPDLSVLTVPELDMVIGSSIGSIEEHILGRRMAAITQMKSAFEKLGLDGTVLGLINQSLVDTAFREILTVVTSHPLEGASLNEVWRLFDSMMLFCEHMETKIIDRTLLRRCKIALGRSFSEGFHEERFRRLKDALSVEKWVCVEPEQKHIDILRELIDPFVMSFTLNGDRYGATQSILILL
jgi:hypothetical protein